MNSLVNNRCLRLQKESKREYFAILISFRGGILNGDVRASHLRNKFPVLNRNMGL